MPGRLPPGVAGPGCCQERGGGSGHCGALAWWGGAGQRQVGSARIPECGQAVIALDASQRIVFHNHHPLPEEEKKGTTTKTTPKFFFFFFLNLPLMADWLYIIKQAAGDLPGKGA